MSNIAPAGAETFVHGTVNSVHFNTMIPKRAGGTYEGTQLNFQDSRGQPDSQNWAQQIIDDARNIEIRNALVSLSAAPGAAFTIHKIKNDKGFWNVTRVDMGHVEGNRTTPAAVPGAAPAAPGQPAQAASGWNNDDNKRRSKEDCVRGEAIQAAANALPRGTDAGTIMALAEQFAAYIVPAAGPAAVVVPAAAIPVAAPVAAPTVAAPVAAPAPVTAAPAPVVVAPAPLPVIAAPVVAVAQPAPAPAPALAPVAAPVPGAAPVVAQAGAFDDGFGQ